MSFCILLDIFEDGLRVQLGDTGDEAMAVQDVDGAAHAPLSSLREFLLIK